MSRMLFDWPVCGSDGGVMGIYLWKANWYEVLRPLCILKYFISTKISGHSQNNYAWCSHCTGMPLVWVYRHDVDMSFLRSWVCLGTRSFWPCLGAAVAWCTNPHQLLWCAWTQESCYEYTLWPHWCLQQCLVQAEIECQERCTHVTVILILSEKSTYHLQQTGISIHLHMIFEMIFISQIKETDAYLVCFFFNALTPALPMWSPIQILTRLDPA